MAFVAICSIEQPARGRVPLSRSRISSHTPHPDAARVLSLARSTALRGVGSHGGDACSGCGEAGPGWPPPPGSSPLGVINFRRMSRMDQQPELTKPQILEELQRIGPHWCSPIDLGFGIITKGRRHQRRFARRLRLFDLPADLRGKRVLDIGTWDGFFAFEMERRGAEVLAIDTWDERAFQLFTFARRVKRSRIQYARIDVHDITPETVGQFDLVLCAGVLYHLRNPFLALERIRKVCRGQLILETAGMIPFLHGGYPMIAFFPGDIEAIRSGRDWGSCGAATISWVLEALHFAGFSRTRVVHEPSFRLWKRFLALIRNRPQGGRLVVHAFVEG